MIELWSLESSGSILIDSAKKLQERFKNQKVWATETVKIGGRRFGKPLEYKNLIVELRQETDNQDFQPPVCELVDDLRAWEAEKGFKIDEVNLEFQENNIQR